MCCILSSVLAQIGSAQWVQANSQSRDVLYLEASGPNMFAQTSSGFLISTDNGLQWTQANPHLADSLFNIFPADTVNFLMGTVLSHLPPLPIAGIDLATASIDVSSLLSLVAGVSMLYPKTMIDSVLISLDTGTTALRISQLLSAYALYSAGLSSTYPLSGALLQSLLFSVDGGMQWISIYDVLSAISIRALEKTDTYLFAATNRGVYRTDNNGEHWTQVNNGLTNIDVYALSAFKTMLFAGTNGGVYVTTDSGATWNAASTGLTNIQVRSLAATGTSVFAGTHGGGVFLSTNSGSNWKPVNEGLIFLNVNAIAVSDKNLFAGTSGGGLWRRPLFELVTSVRLGTNDMPVSFVLMQNFPNPFNPSTTIQYGLRMQSRVRLVVYNLLGQVVAELINTVQQAGWNRVVWNGNGTSGLYFYRLEAVTVSDPNKRFVDVKKMLLLK